MHFSGLARQVLFTALVLYFMLHCATERNQISRSQLYNVLPSLEDAAPKAECAQHMEEKACLVFAMLSLWVVSVWQPVFLKKMPLTKM